jgi:formamidopyrimidine-DNA glycosylase
MPELPEVETTARGILPHIEGQVIARVIIRQRKLRFPIPLDLEKILQGVTITKVKRVAKYLLLESSSGTLILHLGMSGTLRIFTQYQPPKKHDHVDIEFANHKILRFNDPRRFGSLLWTMDEPLSHPLLKSCGVEPLTKQFSGHYLWSITREKKISIKALLMNHKMVSGIGNIYATEALHASGIFPDLSAHLVTLEKCHDLVKSIKDILKLAIKRGGTTLKDFTDSTGKPGYFANQLKVYGRAGLPCFTCRTTLDSMIIAQRSTVYCPCCQFDVPLLQSRIFRQV